MADMKGDLSGISQTGKMTDFIAKRCQEFGIQDPDFQPCPVRFYDVYGEQGFPMRTTISAMGPQLLARLMDLNETQTGVLNIVVEILNEDSTVHSVNRCFFQRSNPGMSLKLHKKMKG